MKKTKTKLPKYVMSRAYKKKWLIPKFTLSDTHSILNGAKCPVAGYCLNGGTCQFFQAIGELSCM